MAVETAPCKQSASTHEKNAMWSSFQKYLEVLCAISQHFSTDIAGFSCFLFSWYITCMVQLYRLPLVTWTILDVCVYIWRHFFSYHLDPHRHSPIVQAMPSRWVDSWAVHSSLLHRHPGRDWSTTGVLFPENCASNKVWLLDDCFDFQISISDFAAVFQSKYLGHRTPHRPLTGGDDEKPSGTTSTCSSS